MAPSILVSLVLIGCGGGIKSPPAGGDDEGGDDSPATFDLSVDAVDFGEVPFGQLEQQTVTVTNSGGASLLVNSLTVNEPFRVTPSNMTLNPGSSTVITIFAQVTTYDDFSDVVTIVTADEDIGTIELPVTASTITDADGDGYDTIAADGGTDCDDGDAGVNPGATETWYDGIDQNCDGASDYDQDGDGYESDAFNADSADGGGDCQDTSVDYYPGAPDEPYDNRDTNCDGANDWDYDGDGYGSQSYGHGSDCDDFDPAININGAESLNGADDDCDGETDTSALAENAPYIYDAAGRYDRMGYSAAIGDLNGDGNAEIVFGAPYEGATTPAGNGAGMVGVFLGGDLAATGTDVDRADHKFQGVNPSDLLGTYVSVIGDFDGDGTDDLAMTAGNYGSGSGAVYLLSGPDAVSSRTDLSDAMAVFTADNGATGMGRGLGTRIDLDGDGMDELVSMYAVGSTNCLAIEYGNGSPSSHSTSSMDALISTTGSEVAFYRNAPVGGDLDGDGFDDLLVSDGAADYGATTDAGEAWVLWGRASHYGTGGIDSVGTTLVHGTTASDGAAWATQIGDDWDGDGDGELWIYNHAEALYVVEGDASLRDGAIDVSDAAAVSYTWNASSPDAEQLRRVGDYTGDGVDDMIVFLEDQSGSYGENEVFSSEIRSGRKSERSDRIGDLSGSSDHNNGNVGYGMAALPGDVDGDGDDDFAMGDPDYGSSAGEAYVLVNASRPWGAVSDQQSAISPAPASPASFLAFGPDPRVRGRADR